MPIVKRKARYVTVAYELCCGFERATALADDLCAQLKADPGFDSAADDTRGWDGDRQAVVVVTYTDLDAANRLDAQVRRLLSRNVDFTCEWRHGVSYGSRGPVGYSEATTSVVERTRSQA